MRKVNEFPKISKLTFIKMLPYQQMIHEDKYIKKT